MPHPGDMFIRHVTKRHPAPFMIDQSPDISRRVWRTQSRYRLLDARGDVVARFSKWHYACLAYGAMCERCGVQPVSESLLRKWVRETDMDRARSSTVWARRRRKALD